MKVLVTGGAGFIGSKTVTELIKQGHKVIVLDNLSNGLKENIDPNAEFLYGDILDSNVFKSIGRVDAVIHLAAKTSVVESVTYPNRYEENNVIGTINTLEYMKDNKIKKIVFSSSAAVYGNPIKIPIPETHPINPLSPYAVSKINSEEYIILYNRLYGIKYTIFRYFNVIGEGQNLNGNAINAYTIFNELSNKNRTIIIYGDGMQVRDFISVEKVSKLNRMAVEMELYGIFNVGTGEGKKILDFAKEIIKTNNSKSKITFMPKRSGEIQESVADITKIKSMLEKFQIDFNKL